MKLVIGSDHAGFDLKEILSAHLRERGSEVLDVGTYSRDPVDYPATPPLSGKPSWTVVRSVEIFICGSGVGASVAANKIRGIFAGICHDNYSAHQGVEHDNMNVLVLGSRVIGFALAQDLVDTFIGAKFTNEERHVRRLNKVRALEANFAAGKRGDTK